MSKTYECSKLRKDLREYYTKLDLLQISKDIQQAYFQRTNNFYTQNIKGHLHNL